MPAAEIGPPVSGVAPSSNHLVWEDLTLVINNVNLSISTVRRDGPLNPILFLHGFGSTKEDFTDVIHHAPLSDYSLLAYDAPGSGASTSSDYNAISMPFLVAVAEAVLDAHKIKRFHLVGHSMGGLTGLLLAQRNPDALLSFTNIKGNLAPEDCFLSRQIFDFPASDTEMFIASFIERTRRSADYGNGIYAAGFRSKVRPEVMRPTFESMVHYSDKENLLSIFQALPCPRMFMFGESYNKLSYLSKIAKAGVELAEIPNSGHFIMYTNPSVAWQRIQEFIDGTSR
ncbi:hypothetical protein CNYM01_04245 [Colletotrichum nymphaeae SA-01]|uniref:AB hydrolase-1 domain-containing protein n=1 Tax=Colletotrichum nymphaeae SA-01 TaxID=1460502 RepID=A0A135STP0_9PEZI|nr:hypothetical protein CNYM01_04245 [Colletotrichum nymphaeae SA-01]